MKKMNKHHRRRASLKERTLKNSPAWRRLTRKESGAGLIRAESPGGEGELTHDQHSTTPLKTMKVSKRLEDRITSSHKAPQELSGRGRRSPW